MRFKHLISKGSLTAFIAVAASTGLGAWSARAQVVDFEDVSAGSTVECGTTIISQGVPIIGEPFPFISGGSNCGVAPVMSDGTQNSLAYDMVQTRFVFPCCPVRIVFDYVLHGGQMNLRVNGELSMVSDAWDLDGKVLGAGTARAAVKVLPTDMIEITSVTGCISDFSVGGESLEIDNVAYTCDPCDASTDPISQISSPVNGECVCDPATVTGSAYDPEEGLGQWSLEYRELLNPAWNSIVSGTSPVINGTLGTWNTGALSEGYHLLRLRTVNACGDDSDDIVAVKIDNLFESFAVSGPAASGVYGRNICIYGTAWDSCFDSYTVDYRVAGSLNPFAPVDPVNPIHTATKINQNLAVWDTQGQSIPDGNYEIMTEGITHCGNTATDLRTITVDNTPPTAVITSPVNCDCVEPNVQVVSVFGTAFDDNMDSWSLQYAGGSANNWITIASGSSNVINDKLGDWNIQGLGECCYVLRLVVRDKSILDCNGAINHVSTFHTLISLGCCPEEMANLGISVTPEGVLLSAPMLEGNWTVEETDELHPNPSWNPVQENPVPAGDFLEYTIPFDKDQAFYRLNETP